MVGGSVPQLELLPFRSMAANAILLFLGLLLLTLKVTDAQIGVCYGRDGNNLPSPADTVALYKQNNIGSMRIYFPDKPILDALRGSNIQLVLGVPNDNLQQLANDFNAAKGWVQSNVLNYYPSVRIKYIVVGNEVTPVNANSRYAQFVVRAMTNVFNAIRDAGLFGQIRVSTSIDTSVIGTNFPPSAATFRSDVMDYMNPVIGFSSDLEAPLFVNVYTYFSYTGPTNLKLSYGLFTNPSNEFVDNGNGLPYQNLFDAILDGVYAALEKAGGGGSASRAVAWPTAGAPKKKVKVVISESGWPSAGGRPRGRLLADGALASFDNARTYLQNLVRHVKGGSPRRPNEPIETYLFAMYDENLKNPEDEKHFGLFNPVTRQPKYQINFS